MTWTYGNDPQHSRLDRIRLLIGDTDENQPLIGDEELNFSMKQHESDELAAADACDAIAARYCNNPYLVKHYRQLAEELRDKAARQAKGFSGGIGKGPRFERDKFP
jgi:hypothetical protein